MTTKSWLWPDRAIGQKEARQLREEHNAVVNSHTELLEACESALTPLQHLQSHGTLPEGYELSDLPVIDLIRAISKATAPESDGVKVSTDKYPYEGVHEEFIRVLHGVSTLYRFGSDRVRNAEDYISKHALAIATLNHAELHPDSNRAYRNMALERLPANVREQIEDPDQREG
jgi:hypothetical protein